jgi:ribosomal protein S18 acetylase RimI-like enzyme
MSKQNIIKLLENCYQMMTPAYIDHSLIFAWFTGIPHPLFNIVTHFSYKKNIAEKMRKLMEEAPANMAFSFWNHSFNRVKELEPILIDLGFQSTGFFPAMRWPVKRVEVTPLEIHPADISTFRRIIAISFGLPEGVVEGWIHLLQNGEHESYLAYLNGNPVGTGTLFIGNQVGVILNIATLSQFRKRGVGRAMMLYLMNRAHTLRLKELILQSAPTAKKLYENLGFKTECDIEVFMHKAAFREFM